VILAILAMIMIGSALKRPATGKDKTPIFPGKQALFSIIGVMVGLGVYISLIEVLGYLVDTFLLVLFLMKVVEREQWRMSLIVSVCTTVGLFVTFQLLLQITLPSNMFGF
jgi:putative tricarboxylic transport membrane protein